jgi:hypothetical protein
VSQPKFRKSSRCESHGCVEVADTSDANYVRDSKRADSPVLEFPRASWAAFIDAVKTGDI